MQNTIHFSTSFPSRKLFAQCGVCLCAWVHGCMHLLTGAATAGSRLVKEKHAGAIHQSLAGLLQIAGHFLIAFGRLSHQPLDLRVTNQQLTQTESTCTHANTLTHTLLCYLFTQDRAYLAQYKIAMGRIQYCRQYAFILLVAMVVCNAISVNCSL